MMRQSGGASLICVCWTPVTGEGGWKEFVMLAFGVSGGSFSFPFGCHGWCLLLLGRWVAGDTPPSITHRPQICLFRTSSLTCLYVSVNVWRQKWIPRAWYAPASERRQEEIWWDEPSRGLRDSSWLMPRFRNDLIPCLLSGHKWIMRGRKNWREAIWFQVWWEYSHSYTMTFRILDKVVVCCCIYKPHWYFVLQFNSLKGHFCSRKKKLRCRSWRIRPLFACFL